MVVERYSIVRLANGRLEYVPADAELPAGARLQSVGNTKSRCLTPTEMLEKGMVQNSYGLWSTGKSHYTAT